MSEEELYDEDRDENYQENEGVKNPQGTREPYELKPCPFCGSNDTILIDCGEMGSYVECKSCNVCSAMTNKDSAIELWNRRV